MGSKTVGSNRRNRRPRRPPTRLTLAHGAMITAGLATFVTVGSVLRDRDATVEVVVLAADAAPGTASGELPLTSITVSADAPFLEIMIRPEALPAEQALSRPLSAGDPLLRSDLVAAETPVLTRTASVSVDPVAIAGLGLVVGDRVDVIGLGPDEQSRFVLDDIRVSRLPGLSGPDGLLSGPSSSFVTLEVDDAEALALVTAQRLGPIELIRSTGAPGIAVTPPAREPAATPTETPPPAETAASGTKTASGSNAASGTNAPPEGEER